MIVRLDDGVQFSIVGSLPSDGTGEDDQLIAQALRNVISGNRGWGVHVSGLKLSGQDRGVFHLELAHDPFKVPEALIYEVDDPESEEPIERVKPYGTLSNFVYGNNVGVDGSGAAAAGNGLGGVKIDNAAAYTIVGNLDAPLEQQWWGNVISANGGPGVEIAGRGTAVNVLGGNLIGLSADGEIGLGNAGPGVWIHDQPVATNVGGDVFNANLGSRNYIADNNGPGILLERVYDLARAVITGETAGTPLEPLDDLTNSTAWNAALGVGTNYFETAITSNWIGLGVEFELGADPETGFVTRVGFTPKPLGNHGDGIEIIDSSNTDIGGAHPGWTKNTISANDGHGVHISGDKSFLNFISQAHIGTDPTGTSGSNSFGSFANDGDGVRIDTAAHHNLLDGTGMGVDFFSVQLLPSIENGGNGTVILEALRASFDVADSGVVISNNGGNGVVIDGADWNQVGGALYVGTNLGGTAALGNAESGVLITGGATLNQVGPRGPRVEQRITYENGTITEIGAVWGDVIVPLIISANGGAGVTIEETGSDSNSIFGSLIGVGYDAGSMIGLGNQGPGVLIRDGASFNFIDEITLQTIPEPEDPEDTEAVFVTRKNVIVANGTTEAPRAGIEITGAGTDGNKVYKSLIGTNEAGATNLGNTGDGVLITASASQNLIGGAGKTNVIARNGTASLEEGNTATYAGVAIKGTASSENVVESNTIKDNLGDGVFINEAADNQVLANTIDQNASHGVEIIGTAENNAIGGAGTGDGNTITRNGASGVAIQGNSLQIIGWGIDEFGYLTLTLNPLDGVYVSQQLAISGFGLVDGDLNPFVVSAATVVSIDAELSTIVTNVALPADADGDQDQGAYVIVSAPTGNIVQGNLIGTDAQETDLGNVDDGVLIAGSANNWVTANTIAFNGGHGTAIITGAHDNIVGTKIENDVTLGSANIITQNDDDGVFVSSSNSNVFRQNTISQNGLNGVEFTNKAKYNLVLSSTIEQNEADGVHIANGAEGNGIGIHIQLVNEYGGTRPRILDPTAGNTIANNVGQQVQIDGEHTYYNFVTGGNTIVAGANQTAIQISNQAWDNVVGNGGEGFSQFGQTYILEHGNSIEYGSGGKGIEAVANGAEGSALVGNSYVGDLAAAIVLDSSSANAYKPPTVAVSIDAGVMTIDYNAQTTGQGAMRLDFYLMNPTTGEMAYLGGVATYDPATGAQQFLWTIDTSLGSLSGWYVTATATYKRHSDNTLKAGSVTSQLSTPIAL
jgi:parallel beta-helix repeat protein